MHRPIMPCTHINDIIRPLIFLGTNSNLYKLIEICQLNNINVAGVIDSDYYNNSEEYCGIKVISADNVFKDQTELNHLRKSYNFFCAVNWTPMKDSISLRNNEKRKKYLEIIEEKNLSCISIIAPMSFVSPSVTIGKNCFIDNMVHIESRVMIDDFVSIYAKSHIGHDAKIGKNSVLQRMCVAPSNSIIESQVYFGPMVKALKDGAVFGSGTFIHEGVYIRRGTLANEVVSLNDATSKRTSSALDNCL